MEDEISNTIDDVLDSLEKQVGSSVDSPRPHNTQITQDGIIHWIDGIGVSNPLYSNEEYAKSGPYEGIIAPPSFLYTANRTWPDPISDIQTMYGGDNWRWFQPLYQGYSLTSETELEDVSLFKTRYGGESIKQQFSTTFYNNQNIKLAERKSWFFRINKDSIDKSRYDDIQLKSWSTEEIDKIKERYSTESPRGAEPRYFESVREGDTIGPVLKGPTTIASGINFLVGWGGEGIHSHGEWFEKLENNPSREFTNSQGAPVPIANVHWDHEFARNMGLPGPWGYGPERPAWFDHLIAYWKGDLGFLEQLKVELRFPNLLGDTTECMGTITEKSIVDDRHKVHLDLIATNQRDIQSATGTATVILPSTKQEYEIPDVSIQDQ